MKCWICGNIANSGEHKIKKSSLVKIYKNNFDNKEMLYCNEDNNCMVKLPGANSKKLKYQNTICTDCNNAKTQDFDLAYDIFFDYCIQNLKIIFQKRVIDFFDVYGDSFPKQQTDLFKYFVKLFGCDLYKNGRDVPFDLIELLDKENFQTALQISFTIDESKIEEEHYSSGIGTLVHSLDSSIKYKWDMFFPFIKVIYWYNTEINGPFGDSWIADKRYIYLGYTNHEFEKIRLERI
jgi:hypothetical protein